ncbi:pentapeptide repeat-containing protein [Hyalangium versicolor]|uniref:WD40 domain-containing protein n=1 Tax=Hyalangium versicolor TaxID=2861190 RepID=UPI001CCE5172|nr:pentapeptide repeat-containing protein [Hyalangium versicolor]
MGFRRYDVLIITALLDELDAVLALGEGGKDGWETAKDGNGFPFHFRELPREDGEPLRVAAASFDEMGGDATALRATALIKFLDPACLAMCGICAGKKKDVFLGDVIVASRVYRYDAGKFSAGRRDEEGLRVEEFFHDFKTFNLKDTWRVDAAYFARDKDWAAELVKTRPLSLETQEKWFLRVLLEQELHGAAAPDKHPDRKKECPTFSTVRDRLRQRGLLVNKPGVLALTEEGRGYAIDLSHEDEAPKDPEFRVHVGPIATGEIVQKDPELFQRLEKIGRKTLGAEMEAAAIGRVGEHLGRPTLIVKAVSDYGDEDKDDAFRKFATHAAAQVLIRLLLRNLEPVAQQLEDFSEAEPHDSRALRFERMGLDRRDDLLSQVQTLARLRMETRGETAEIVRVRAPAPFGGYLRVSKVEGAVTSVSPIAVVDALTLDVLEAFLDTIDARYRRNDPSIQSVLVYGGAPPSDDVLARARKRRVFPRSFTEYQGLIDFRGYSNRQLDRLEKDLVYPPALYVAQRAVIHSEGGEFSTADVLGELNTLLVSPHPRFILVLGEFGAGKTFLLHELARRMIKDGGPLVPVLIEMRTLEKAQELNALVSQHMAKAGEERIDLPAFHYMLSHGRIALLFDGFDELALRVSYERAVEHFSTLIQAAQGEAKIVITSRTQHFYSDRQVVSALGEQASSQRGYRLVKLQRFTHEQVQAFLEKRLGDPVKAAQRLKLLSEVRDLLGLAENPRMLGFIADIDERKLLEARERDREITSARLYEMLLRQWLDYERNRADAPGGLVGLTVVQRWRAVTEVAMRLWHETSPSLNILELPAELTAAVKELAEHTLSSAEVQHQIGSGTLLVRDEGNNFSFIHQSVMEWLVAKAVSEEILQGGAAVVVLRAREMSPLMADFVWGLAGRKEAEEWARQVLRDEAPSAIQKNALLMLKRLGVEGQVGLRLAGLDLSGKDFSGQDLRNADLTGANLTGAKLVGTDLTGAKLTKALLRRADLSRAMLTKADLRGADLLGARLVGATAKAALLAGAMLRQAKLSGACFDEGALEGLDRQALFGAARPEVLHASPTVSSNLPCYGVAFSPDGILLAAGNGFEIRLWDLETGSMLRTLSGHDELVRSVSFSPDGTMLASGSGDGTVRLWDMATGTERRVLQGPGASVMSVSFSPDGATLASGAWGGKVRLWDVATGTERCVLQGPMARVMSVSFSPDGATLASGSEDGKVRLWDVAMGTERRVLQGPAARVRSVSFSPDGATLASGAWDGTVRLWDVATGTERRVLQGPAASVMSVSFSPDGATLASGSDDGTVRLWDVATGTERRVLQVHEASVMSVSFSLDGATLASGAGNGTVRLWDVATGTERRVLQGSGASVMSVSFSSHGAMLASGAGDGTVRLWNAATGTECRVHRGPADRVRSVSFSPDGATLASGAGDGTVRLWDVATGTERRMLQERTDRVRSVSFSPDGATLVSGSEDGKVRLWDVATGTERRVLRGHAASVMSVSFSPDGATLASGAWDGTVRLWDVTTGTERRVLQGSVDSVVSVSFSPDGATLASGAWDGRVLLWDVVTGAERRVLQGPAARVRSVSFSPDGATLASGSEDGKVRLWDVATGTKRRVLRGHADRVWSVSFSPDGAMLASGSEDGTVRLWDVFSAEFLAALVSLEEGWVAFTTDGRYRSGGNLGGAFWHAVALCRFEPGELTPSLHVPDEEPLHRLPRSA